MSTFKCYYCKDELPASMAKKYTITSTGWGKCKPCHNKYSFQHQIKKKLKTKPENYLLCTDCDMYMPIYEDRKHTELREKCKFCESLNLEKC